MDYGYSNPWGMALQQPIGGLMSPFTPWGLGAMGEPVQPQEAMAPRGVKSMDQRESGDTPGYSAPGDPNTAMQTSQATKDRVASSVGRAAAVNAGKAAIGAAGAYASGMPGNMIGQGLMSAMASPSSIGGILGGAVNATLGTQPSGWLGKTVANVSPVVGSIFGGPIGGMIGGLLGGPLGDAIGDYSNTRSNEAVRDGVEDNRGYGAGRRGFADMQSAMTNVNDIQSAVANAIGKVNAARAVAGLDGIGYAHNPMSMDKVAPGGYGLGGTGSSNTARGWGGYDPGHASTGFGLSNRAAEIARGALDGVDFGGFSVGGRGGSGGGGDRGGFGANDGNSDTAGNAGFGR